jgi:uncharacterized protein YabN with tetrapyrrole methylase and pyrophosphatase domain
VGCRANLRTLAQYLLEECYETFDAIQEAAATGDTTNLREELGDVLLQVVFHSTIARKRRFYDRRSVAGVTEKLILRHPHVFGETELENRARRFKNWDELKKAQRKRPGKIEKQKDSILEDVPVHFPALLEGRN